jgi:hypothetical protein
MTLRSPTRSPRSPRSPRALPALLASDPSVEDGGEVVFDDELTLEFRVDGSAQWLVHFRIITRSSDDVAGRRLEQVRFEIFTDADVYFYAQSVIDAEQFAQLKIDGELLVDFEDFPREVERLLRESQAAQSEMIVTYERDDDGVQSLEFRQQLELTAVPIFSLKFEAPGGEFLHQQAQYRYERLGYDLACKNAMLDEFKRYMHSRSPLVMRSIDGSPRSPRHA